MTHYGGETFGKKKKKYFSNTPASYLLLNKYLTSGPKVEEILHVA